MPVKKTSTKRSIVSAQKYVGGGCRVCVDKSCTAKIIKCSEAVKALRHAIKGGLIAFKKKK